MSEEIMIVDAESSGRMRMFMRFPHQLYRHDPCYVPSPHLIQKHILSRKRNPFFRSGDASFFLAVSNKGEVLGRIAAVYNPQHLARFADGAGFFGFFDCINDAGVARLLIDKAAEWLRQRGLKKMIGPENLTNHDTIGILTRGFEDPPAFLMPYNFPYYQDLLLKNGLQPLITLYSYKANPGDLPADIQAKARVLESRLLSKGIRFRLTGKKSFPAEMHALREVYNRVNSEHFGFTPIDEKAFQRIAADLHRLTDEHSVILVEKGESLIGYIVFLPDYNQVFKHFRNGQLLPFGWLHFLRRKRLITRIRIIVLGVLPEYRGMGIDFCLYARVAQYLKRKHYAYGEASYVLEKNTVMNRIMKNLGASVVKEYVLFEKSILY